MTNSQLDTTNESQEVSPFPAGDHEAHINRRAQRHSKHETEKIKDPQKKYRLRTVTKIFYWRALTGFTAPTSPLILMWTRKHLGKRQNTRKHNIHDSQEVSSFPAGDHKATRNRHDSTTHTNMKHS